MEHCPNHIKVYPTWIFKAKISYCQIWEHATSHIITQAYPVQNYDRTHARIHRNKPHVVNTLGVATNHPSMKTYLLIQRIPNRLSEIGTLNESQTLKVLYSVFKGLEEIQPIFGLVHLNEGCICFNEIGKVKIWINPNLSLLYPVSLVKQSGKNKIIQILSEVVNMVEHKCFNSSFLQIFKRKLQQDKITSFKLAAQQIIKMSQLLFIDIQQKPINFPSIPYVPIRKNVHNKLQYSKTQRDEATSGVGVLNYVRKISTHKPYNRNYHRRIQSFLEKEQNKKECKVNKSNNFSINLISLNEHKSSIDHVLKSAPISPRQQTRSPTPKQIRMQNFHKKQSEQNSLQKKQGVPKLRLNFKNPVFHPKKQNDLKPIIQPLPQQKFNDSFSYNLNGDAKEVISGEFRTFGILDDLNGQSGSDLKEQFPKKPSQFNIQFMDAQIQKKLLSKKQENRNEIKRISIEQKNKGELQQLNQKNVDIQIYKFQQTGGSERSSAAFLQSKPKEKENLKQSDPGVQYKRQKSLNLAYIDKKYEEYIRINNKNQDKLRQKFEPYNLSMKISGMHFKQVGNFSIYNPNKNNLFSANMNSNKNLYGPNPMTERSYQPSQYQISTKR